MFRAAALIVCLACFEQPARAEERDRYKESIREVIRSHMAQVRKCYEAERLSNEESCAPLTIRFIVEKDGAVSSAMVMENRLPATIGQCVQDRLRTWRFPANPAGPVSVTYPFRMLFRVD
jgi:hypothetical protein